MSQCQCGSLILRANDFMNRTVCPKCRANNMPGQTNCFQCGSSLPPPEPASLPIAPDARAQYHNAPPASFPRPPFAVPRRSPWEAIVICAAVLAVVCGSALLFAARRPNLRQSAAMSAGMQAAELDQLRRAHGLGPTASSTGSGDDSTRRELDRLREKYGLNTGNPHNPNDGSAPNGGAITFDQYRREHPDAANYQFR